MRTEEDRRLADRSAEQRKRFMATLQIFVMILLLNIALIAALYMLQRRETERARQLNEELEHGWRFGRRRSSVRMKIFSSSRMSLHTT